MRHRLLAATAALALFATGATAQAPMLGFSPGDAAKEHATETKFDAGLSAAQQRDWLKLMSAKANQVGSPPRQRERRLDAGAVQELGLGSAYRDLQGALPDAFGGEA